MRQIVCGEYDDWFSFPTIYKPAHFFIKYGNCIDLTERPTNHPSYFAYDIPDIYGEPRSGSPTSHTVFLHVAPGVEPSTPSSVGTSMMFSPYSSTSTTWLLSGMPSSYPSRML